MKMCQNHWDTLRDEITRRGLNDLVASSGEEVMTRLKNESDTQISTIENFDPLMCAHNLILINTLDLLKRIGENPLVLMIQNEDFPDRECPICYLNFLSQEHDARCADSDCTKIRGQRFDEWIQLAAQGAEDHAKKLLEQKEIPLS